MIARVLTGIAAVVAVIWLVPIAVRVIWSALPAIVVLWLVAVVLSRMAQRPLK